MAPSLPGAAVLQVAGVFGALSVESGPTAIDRVVGLLEEMQSTMQEEQKVDQDAYNKMDCWCQTTSVQKKEAVADAEASIDELEALVEGGAAEGATLTTNVKQNQKELTQKTQALSAATSVREKEAASFRSEEKDSVQALSNLKNAIMVLSKRNGGFFQLSVPLQVSLKSVLALISLKHEELMTMDLETIGTVTTVGSSFLQQATKSVDTTLASLIGGVSDIDILPEYAEQVLAEAAKGTATALIQEPSENNFAKKPGGREAYNSRSGAILGILKQMQDDFESNLSVSQKDEINAAKQYEDLKEIAVGEIKALKSRIDKMQGENSGSVKSLADAKEDLTLMREQRAADVKFLSDLNLQCKDLDRQFDTRTEARMTEVKAVTEALDIIQSDDARALFQKNVESFLQVSDSTSKSQMMARSRSARVLLEASKLLQSPDFGDLLSAYQKAFTPFEKKPHEQLASVAVMVQLDTFKAVKKACDDMIKDLKAEQQVEVNTKSNCKGDLGVNEKETYTTSEELADIQDKIESLEDKITKLEDEIKEMQDQVKDMNIQIKQASLDRKKENEVFQQAVSDERAVQKVLSMAADRLKEVYKSPGGAFVQQDPVSPVQFKPTKKNAGGSSVVSLIEQIVEDSKKVETDLEAAETSSQQNYATFVRDAAATLQSLNDSIDEKNDFRSQANVELSQAEAHSSAMQDALSSLHDVARDLHEQCDFILDNFDIRQKARLQEIEAIQKAKAYLSGMTDE